MADIPADTQVSDAGKVVLDPNQTASNGAAGQGSEVASTTPGAEQSTGTPKEPAAQTFTQADIDKAVATAVGGIQSAKDKELAQQRQITVDLARKAQEDAAKATENIAAARDARSVEDGDMTQDEATRRQGIRTETAQMEARLAQSRSDVSQVVELGEAEARPVVAGQLETYYGLAPGTLLNDPSLADARVMWQKAESLHRDAQNAALQAREEAVANKEAPVESFAKAGVGDSSTSTPDVKAALDKRYPSMTDL